MKVVYWLRQDLRIQSNYALSHACAVGEVYPVFIAPQNTGGASKWWLHQSLKSLGDAYQSKDIALALAAGDPIECITTLSNALHADLVVWNRVYTPDGIELGEIMRNALDELNIKHRSFNSQLLLEPTKVFNKQGTPFKVFTPFWRHCRSFLEPQTAPKLSAFKTQSSDPIAALGSHSRSLDELGLTPSNPDWAAEFSEFWSPGEAGAQAQWQEFMDDSVDDYGDGRDFPALGKTSGLSPHLAWGEISPEQIFAECCVAIDSGQADAVNANKFLSEIGWREFCSYLLCHFPHLPEQAFNAKFDAFPWQQNQGYLKAWQQGKTGYPIVDAGMRELWQSGYMHNRVRMIVASFLTKHLMLDWREGADWFWDTLLDADLANNTAGWQWAAGCGADAAPYFRIFNPILQGQKFDKRGEYVRQWVPELATIPDKWLYTPWEAPVEVLEQSNVVLGSTYPMPVVDHKQARELALSTYQQMKAG